MSKVNFLGTTGLLENIPIGSTGRYVRLQHTREIQLVATLAPYASIFSNPAISSINLQAINVADDAVIEYSLFNLMGQRVWHKLGGKVEKFNAENLGRRTYIIKITGSDWTQTEKLMVE